MVAPTSSSSLPRVRNPLAGLSVVLGALALAAVPALVAGSRWIPRLTLLESVVVAVPAAVVLGVLAVLTARRARRRLELTLGRCGGEGAARTGRLLAFVGIYLGCTGAIALAFYGVLRHYS